MGKVKSGIDDIAIYVPCLYADMKDFADLRGLNPDKLRKGIGVSQMSMVDSNQDPNVLAANAAMKIIDRNGLKPEQIGRMYLSTESSVDESKAMNSYVIGMLEQKYGKGSFEHCGGVETKFACVSGSYALYDNANWIRSGEAGDQYALVILSDIAKYDAKSGGEQTQGAGAVAMLLNNDPRLLAFDDNVTATSIKDEYDFYRPFGKETPIVNGKYSNFVYMSQVDKAFQLFKKKAIKHGVINPKEGESVLDNVDYVCFHLPYPNMGKKAVSYLLRREWRDLPRWDGIKERIGEDPIPRELPRTKEEFASLVISDDFVSKNREFERKFIDLPEFQTFYTDKVESGLEISGRTGNWYTGSTYLGFRSLVEYEHKKKQKDLAGKRVVFGSYGSGASAMVFSGVVQEPYKEVVSGMDFEQTVADRERLSMADYVALHDGYLGPENSIRAKLGIQVRSGKEFLLQKVGKTKDNLGERMYRLA